MRKSERVLLKLRHNQEDQLRNLEMLVSFFIRRELFWHFPKEECSQKSEIVTIC